MCKKEDCFWYRREHHTDHYTDDCGRNMPDSMDSCKGICKHFEPRKEKQLTIFDELNKMCFNEIPSAANTPAYQQVKRDTEELIDNCIKAIEGVGKDAEVITNENGGKQSKTPMALHLVDPKYLFLALNFNDSNIQEACEHLTAYMIYKKTEKLFNAMDALEPDRPQQIIKIAKVLQEGADKYEPNNWRLIPQEQHINHALIHLFAAALGDTQDNHLDHALCRLMMAYATKPSENFSYTEYKKKVS